MVNKAMYLCYHRLVSKNPFESLIYTSVSEAVILFAWLNPPCCSVIVLAYLYTRWPIFVSDVAES